MTTNDKKGGNTTIVIPGIVNHETQKTSGYQDIQRNSGLVYNLIILR
ncbi:MAG: hypothetical protein M0Q91_14975 [Methanoregula sp.]|nr:hypothetical protein [Methanoregula sp.]